MGVGSVPIVSPNIGSEPLEREPWLKEHSNPCLTELDILCSNRASVAFAEHHDERRCAVRWDPAGDSDSLSRRGTPVPPYGNGN